MIDFSLQICHNDFVKAIYNLLILICDAIRCLFIFLAFVIPVHLAICLRAYIQMWGLPRFFLNLLLIALFEAAVIIAAIGCEKIRKWYGKKLSTTPSLSHFDTQATDSLEKFYRKIDEPPFPVVMAFAYLCAFLLFVVLPIYAIWSIVNELR